MGSKGKSLFTFDRDDIADFEMSRSQASSSCRIVMGSCLGKCHDCISAFAHRWIEQEL